jgi:hypothetical protein
LRKEAVNWVNLFNNLFLRHCQWLGTDSFKLRLFQLKEAVDERQRLTQYVANLVAAFPFGLIPASAPAKPNPWLNGGQPDPTPSKSDLAAMLAAELDAAYPFPKSTYEGRDNAVCTMAPWSAPVPLKLRIAEYLFNDMVLMQPSLKWITIQYDANTHSVRPVLADANIAELEQPTRIAGVPHILQAYMQVHGFLSGWVCKMAETKKAVPFYVSWGKRMHEARVKEAELLATRHPLFVDGDAVAWIRDV